MFTRTLDAAGGCGMVHDAWVAGAACGQHNGEGRQAITGTHDKKYLKFKSLAIRSTFIELKIYRRNIYRIKNLPPEGTST